MPVCEMSSGEREAIPCDMHPLSFRKQHADTAKDCRLSATGVSVFTEKAFPCGSKR